MKFVFMAMGDYKTEEDRAGIAGGSTRIIGVSSLEEACRVAQELQKEGVDFIELCGAFEEAGARAVIEATGNRIPVGYVVHLPEQDAMFRALFGE